MCRRESFRAARQVAQDELKTTRVIALLVGYARIPGAGWTSDGSAEAAQVGAASRRRAAGRQPHVSEAGGGRSGVPLRSLPIDADCSEIRVVSSTREDKSEDTAQSSTPFGVLMAGRFATSS